MSGLGGERIADPLVSARNKADTDDVRQAGYATDEEQTFIAFDESGVPVQRFEFHPDEVGGWLLAETGGCG